MRLDAGLATPIARQPIAEQVTQRIMTLIRTGRLKPGDRLPAERELAAALDVSRASVRESLRALSILGVINIRHGGGAHVSSLEASELLDPLDFYISLDQANLIRLFEARIEFEPMMARIAADRLDDAALERLGREVAEQQAAPDDAEVFHNSDIVFHRIITEACGNPFLSRIAKTLQVMGERARHIVQARTEVRLHSIRDHVAILEALRQRDADAAGSAMRAHFSHVRAVLIEWMGKPT